MSVSKMLKSISIFSFTIIIAISSLLPTFAVEGEGEDFFPPQEESTYLATPELNKPENTEKGVEISWNGVPEAKGYKVFVKQEETWVDIGTTLDTSFIDVNVKSGESYTYTVCCVDEDGVLQTSLFDENGVTIKYMAVPEIVGFSPVAKGTQITWEEVSGAVKYYIYRKVEGKWKYLGSSKTTKYTHKITENNSTDIYSIRSEDETGFYRSGYDSTGASNTFLSAPVLKKIKNTAKGIQIYWNKVPGAQEYKVFVKTDKTWKAIGTTKTDNFIHTGAVSGEKYTYTVRCVSNDGKINESYFESPGISEVFLSVPKGVKFTNVADGTKIKWTAVKGANKYKIYIKNGETWKYIGSTNKAEYHHKITAKNTVYTYRILATNTKNNCSSAVNKAGHSNRFIAPVTISSITYKNGGYQVKWNKVSHVSKYRIYRKEQTSAWVKIADVKNAQYTDKTAKKTGVYTYAVRCLDANAKLISGFRPDNKYYYDGKIAVNRILGDSKNGYYYVDNSGVKCTDAEIQLAVNFLMKYSTGNTPEERLSSAFMYMARNYPYNRSYDHPKKASDMSPLAVDIFRNKKGNCFRQAAATACLARVCGFRARVVVGETLSTSGHFVPHGWTEIYYNGKWRVCDMNAQMRYSYLQYYMLDNHYWTIKPQYRYEVTVSNGNAVWK